MKRLKKILWAVLIAVNCVLGTHALNFGNCDYYVQLDANEGKSVINPGGYISLFGYIGYLGHFEPGSACRYTIESPQNYVIQLYCYINIAVTVNENHFFKDFIFKNLNFK